LDEVILKSLFFRTKLLFYVSHVYPTIPKYSSLIKYDQAKTSPCRIPFYHACTSSISIILAFKVIMLYIGRESVLVNQQIQKNILIIIIKVKTF